MTIRFRAALTGMLIAIGTFTLTYPFAAQWFEQLHQSQANATLAEAVSKAGTESLSELRASAVQYNRSLFEGGGAADHAMYRAQMLTPGTDVIGRLRVPSIDIDQPIRHTMEESALLLGVGHAEGSSLPVGGEGTHAVLGGHRGLAEAIGFTHLPRLRVGDTVYVEALGETLTYRVIETETLAPSAAAVHPIEGGRDLLTLLTCTPLGVNSHRFVVTAERVLPGDGITAGQNGDLPGFPWWAMFLVGGVAMSFGAAWCVGREP